MSSKNDCITFLQTSSLFIDQTDTEKSNPPPLQTLCFSYKPHCHFGFMLKCCICRRAPTAHTLWKDRHHWENTIQRPAKIRFTDQPSSFMHICHRLIITENFCITQGQLRLITFKHIQLH
ncbi:UNVERIFIED_CONTAM: hypothetical protein K2H54_034839 [Gekko kuhli]